MKSLTLKQYARKECLTLSEVRRQIAAGLLEHYLVRGEPRICQAEHPLPSRPTLAQIASYSGRDQADVSSALKLGLLRGRTRGCVDAWVHEGCPSVPRGIDSEDEAESAACARAGALSPIEVLDLQRDRRRLQVRVGELEIEVARLRLEVARAERP